LSIWPGSPVEDVAHGLVKARRQVLAQPAHADVSSEHPKPAMSSFTFRMRSRSLNV